MQTVGQRFLKIRKENGLNQSQMGERLGITQTAYSKIEQNGGGLSQSVIELAVKEFKISADYLLFGNTNDNIDNNNDESIKTITQKLYPNTENYNLSMILSNIPLLNEPVSEYKQNKQIPSLTISNNDLKPLLEVGDIALLKKIDISEIIDGRLYYIIDQNSKTHLNIIDNQSVMLRLTGVYNTETDYKTINKEDIKHIYEVIKRITNMRDRRSLDEFIRLIELESMIRRKL